MLWCEFLVIVATQATDCEVHHKMYLRAKNGFEKSVYYLCCLFDA